VGIYLNYVPSASNLGLPNSGAKVTIAGMQWWTGQSIHHGATLTQFVAVHPVNSVSQLDLSGFYKWAYNHHNYLPTGDCLTDLGLGIEPWSALPPTHSACRVFCSTPEATHSLWELGPDPL
jgi:hypothetical protein